jgi:hypothetical protein
MSPVILWAAPGRLARRRRRKVQKTLFRAGMLSMDFPLSSVLLVAWRTDWR